MANLKQLRTRIKSIKSTSKITKAMQLVAANKLSKIKHELGNASEYINTLDNIVQKVALSIIPEEISRDLHKYFINQDSDNVILVLFTSEKGLCGAFNSQIIKNVKSDIKKIVNQGKKLHLIIVGTKGYNAFKSEYLDHIKAFYQIGAKSLRLQSDLKDKIFQILEEVGGCNCYFYFNKFKNSMLQLFSKTQVLPIEQKTSDINPINYEYETNTLNAILDLYLDSRINLTLLETRAGEEGARMTAMDNATKNANDLVDKLTLELNRKRQSIITKDLIEIIAGAESV